MPMPRDLHRHAVHSASLAMRIQTSSSLQALELGWRQVQLHGASNLPISPF